jgi:hypothetical protein
MSCSALSKNLHTCRNWCIAGEDVCHAHRHVDPDVQKKRWIQRYILGTSDFVVYTFINPTYETQILSDLKSGRIQLTQDDILAIPPRSQYIDIYMLLLKHGFAERGTHEVLEIAMLDYYCFLLAQFPDNDLMPIMRKTIEDVFVLASGKSLYEFLLWLPVGLLRRERLTSAMIRYIPTLLDSPAAKELSWFSYADLDKIRIHYEVLVGKDHHITKYLVQCWLLDLKELYQTEKAIQKIKMDQCKEELMMNRWHPSRLEKWLEAGLDDDDM